MSNKGVITKGIYRKALTALAMMMVMSVVFAFTFTAQTHRIHAGTVQLTADRWSQLKTHINTANLPANKDNTYEITITEDLVACEKLDISGKVVLKSNSQKTIYREKGKTDFSVFNVKSGGNLEITGNVKMTGDTAEAESTTGSHYKLSLSDGYGNYVVKDEEVPVNTDPATYLRNLIGAPGVNGANYTNRAKWDTKLKNTLGTKNTSPYVHGYLFSGLDLNGNGAVDDSDNGIWWTNRSKDLLITMVWRKSDANPDDQKPLTSWEEVDRITEVFGYVLIGEADQSDPEKRLYFGLPRYENAGDAVAKFKKYSDISDKQGVVDERESAVFRWAFSDILKNTVRRMHTFGIGDPNVANPYPATAYTPNASTPTQPHKYYLGYDGSEGGFNTRSNQFYYATNTLKPKVTAKSTGSADNNDYIYFFIENGYLKASKQYNGHADAVNPSNQGYAYMTTDGKIAFKKTTAPTSGSKLGLFSPNQMMAKDDWTPNEKNKQTSGTIENTSGGKIKSDTIKTGVVYTCNDDTVDSANGIEKFSSGRLVDDANFKGGKRFEGRGFFVNVESGGTFKMNGTSDSNCAVLENFKTITEVDDGSKDFSLENTPKCVAPVNVAGSFIMENGYIQHNSVGYTADESQSGGETKGTNNYLKAAEMTNTAGGVIFSGKNATGTLNGGRIRGNKADTGGIIVTDGATVTMNAGSGINKNIGFHHAGAALVQHGGKLVMEGGEMFQNVTWNRGGAVWATQWGTNGFVDADWSGWPKSFPKINNSGIKGEDGYFVMKGGKLDGNTAFIRGGAINVESNGVDLQGGEIINNKCRSLGGAIYVEGDAAEYSYALKINKGYIGNNRSVSRTIVSDNINENITLDRKLDTSNNKNLVSDTATGLVAQNDATTDAATYKDARTYDRDFGSVTGNGGGVWLCPVGGTSVFASNNAIIDNNNADGSRNGKLGGTDFYLSKGNGAAMFKQLTGSWYNQANGQKVDSISDQTNQDGVILNGELRMVNKVTGETNPSNHASLKDDASKGIRIYDNLSRDGGGIACNGTTIFGTPENVYRYDAKIKITKTWGAGTTAEKIYFDILYKDGVTPIGNLLVDNEEDITPDKYSLELDGNKDNVTDENRWDATAVETTEDNSAIWTGEVFIPSYITKPDGTREAVYKFIDPTDSTKTIDPTTMQGIQKIYDYIALPGNHTVNSETGLKEGTLQIDPNSWNIRIKERGNKYDVEMGALSVKIVLKHNPVELLNPADPTAAPQSAFEVRFTNVTLDQAVKNKPAETEVSITKKWLDSDGLVEMTKTPNGYYTNAGGTSNDLGSGKTAFVNWPSNIIDSTASNTHTKATFTISGNSTSKTDVINGRQVRALLANDGTGLSVSQFNQADEIKDRSIVYNSGAILTLEEKKYHAIFIGDELIYAEEAEECTRNTLAHYNIDRVEPGKTECNYIVEKAQAKLEAQGREAEAATLSGEQVNGGWTDHTDGITVYHPKLTYKVPEYDSSGNKIEYDFAEVRINDTNITNNKAHGYKYERSGNMSDGFVATNTEDSKEIQGTKVWKNKNSNLILTQKPNGDTGFTSQLNGNVYLNWANKDAYSIRLAVRNKTKTSEEPVYVDVSVDDLKDLIINNELRTSLAATDGTPADTTSSYPYSKILFHKNDTIEKRYIEFQGKGVYAGKTIAKLGLKKETIDNKTVYSPIVTYVVEKDKEYEIVEKGIAVTKGNYTEGSFGNYTATYSQDTNPMVVTNTKGGIDIPAYKTWLDANGNVYATQKPNGYNLADDLRQITYQNNKYDRYINWPESGADGYTLTLKRNDNTTSQHTIAATDIKALITNKESDMTAATGKTFNSHGDLVSRSIVWEDELGTVKLTLDRQRYCIIKDVNDNVVYTESFDSVSSKCNNGPTGDKAYAWPVDYMVAKAKEVLAAKGKTAAEIEAIMGTDAESKARYQRTQTYVFLFVPKLTYTVDAKSNAGADYTYNELTEADVPNYIKKVEGNQTNGFQVANSYNRVEIPVSKVWKDYDGNIVMSQIDNKWVNWPASGVDFVRLRIEDKSVSPAWEKVEALQKGSVQTALASSNGKTGTWDIAGRGKGYVKVEGKDYYVVQEKATGNKLVMTVPASDASTADAAIAVASQKFGIPATDLEVAGNAVRTIYFPSIVFDIAGKNNNGDIAKYVITELGVGTGGYSDNATIRSDDYVPSYVDADGNTIDVTASITDADAHMATMEDGITIVNDRKVNVKLTKKWKDGSTNNPTWPTTGVSSVEFQLLKYNETSKTYEVVANQNKTLSKSNSTLEWTGLDPGRYTVKEVAVTGYDTEVSDVTITQDSTKNDQDVFNYTVTNTKLTDVQVTKKWNGTSTWPSKISSVNLYLKRWYKYDSFGREIWKRKLNSDTTKNTNTYRLHILKKGTNGIDQKKYVQLDSTNNKYYVEDNGKHYVEDNGYVVIDNMIYALQGGTTKDDYIIRDHNNNKEIVLVDAKDVNGNPITTPSQATSSAATVYWRNLPKYDEGFPVSSTLNDTEKWNVRKIMYWIAEDPITGYLETVVNSPSTNEYSFNVNNTSVDNYTINVNAQKFWNDGGYTSDRPTIKFELWRAKYYRYYGYWVDGTDGAWSKLTGQDSSGHDYDRVITPDMAGSDLTQTWVNLPKQDRTYSYDYAPREAILVGKKANGQEVYVYLNDLSDATMDDENNYPSRGELVITGNATSGYTATVYKLDKDGKRTSTTIATATGITELEESVKGYQTISKYDDITANGCRGFNMKAYNTKPAIEKYVEKDVHKDLDNMTDEFTYDIMAYVPKWSKGLVIKDTLIPALQYVRTNNDVNPTVAFGVTNDHKANGSVSDTTNYTTLSKTEGGKTNYSYQGGDTGNFVLTISEDGVKKILASNADNGKWVRVTLKAKIKNRVVIDGKSVPFEDLTAEQLTAIGFKTVEDNTPVISTISKHTGFKNQASYDLTLDNGFEFKNIESNEVTVVPPATLEVEKKVTGTLGDLNKEFVFHIELNNLQAREGKTGNQTDYEYEVPNGTSVNPKSGDGIEVYRAATMTENDKTYSNGFNLDNNSTTKHLYVKLKAKEKLKIKGLQVGVKYKVTEYASDHVPSYSINDINNVKEVTRLVTSKDVEEGRMVKENGKWVKAESKHVTNTPMTVAANVKMKDGAGKNEALSTSTETVDPGEIVVITYTNHRDIETQTGIIKDTWPWNIILLVLLILLAYDDQMRKIKNRLRLQRLTTTV